MIGFDLCSTKNETLKQMCSGISTNKAPTAVRRTFKALRVSWKIFFAHNSTEKFHGFRTIWRNRSIKVKIYQILHFWPVYPAKKYWYLRLIYLFFLRSKNTRINIKTTGSEMVEDSKWDIEPKIIFFATSRCSYIWCISKTTPAGVQKSSLILAIQMLAVKCPVMRKAFVKFSDPGFLLLIAQTLWCQCRLYWK